MRRICRIVFILMVCCAVTPLPDAKSAAAVQGYSQPQTCPDFSLEDLTGKTVDVRGLRGRVLLINFWATW